MTHDELQAAFDELPELPDTLPPRGSWPRHCYSMRRHVKTDEPDRFLCWSTVSATMVVGDVPYVRAEYDRLEEAGWLGSLDEPGLGDPPRLPYYPSTSGNLVHQAYHLLEWTQTTGLKLADVSSILEFGGGYGALAMMAWRLGFRGEYRLWDLPEFEILQRFYLSNASPGRRFTWGDVSAGTDLLIACYSLSEVDDATRRQVLDRPFNSCLIAYQDRYDEIDNNAWFAAFARSRPEMEWQVVEKDAFQPGHYYLIGRRRWALPTGTR